MVSRQLRIVPVIAAMIALGIMLVGPAPAAAQGLSAENCRATRAILSAAIAGRKAGETRQAIAARLSSGGSGIGARYRATVPPLVELVFKLDPGLLTEATAADYEAQCLAYEG